MGYPLPIRTNTSIYAMSYTTHSALVIMACYRATTRTQQSDQGKHHNWISHMSGAMRPNDQHQRPEPAATEQRMETELNGCLRSAGCCGWAVRSWLPPRLRQDFLKRGACEAAHHRVGVIQGVPQHRAAGAPLVPRVARQKAADCLQLAFVLTTALTSAGTLPGPSM
jgi:hypothetical protein